MLAIIDYGVGNLFSLISSLKKIGEEAIITSDTDIIEKSDSIILPGVGAFGDASKKLFDSGLAQAICREAQKGKPIMGICLGMQLLFDKSFEYGENRGLGLIKGEIRPISERIGDNLKIPHMGWNALNFNGKKHELFKYLDERDYVYFVHSFSAVNCEESIIATAEYGADLTAAVATKNVMGCQFHPEKSGDVGLSILKSFCEMKGEEIC